MLLIDSSIHSFSFSTEVGSPTNVALVFQRSEWEKFFNSLSNNLLCCHMRNTERILSKYILMGNSCWIA